MKINSELYNGPEVNLGEKAQAYIVISDEEKTQLEKKKIKFVKLITKEEFEKLFGFAENFKYILISSSLQVAVPKSVHALTKHNTDDYKLMVLTFKKITIFLDKYTQTTKKQNSAVNAETIIADNFRVEEDFVLELNRIHELISNNLKVDLRTGYTKMETFVLVRKFILKATSKFKKQDLLAGIIIANIENLTIPLTIDVLQEITSTLSETDLKFTTDELIRHLEKLRTRKDWNKLYPFDSVPNKSEKTLTFTAWFRLYVQKEFNGRLPETLKGKMEAIFEASQLAGYKVTKNTISATATNFKAEFKKTAESSSINDCKKSEEANRQESEMIEFFTLLENSEEVKRFLELLEICGDKFQKYAKMASILRT